MYRYPACPDAVARIRGGAEAPAVSGQVRFYQERGSVLVKADLSGLPQESETGFFAMHIHEGDACAGENFSQTGGHYNPKDVPHPNHAGDLPPLLAYGESAHLAVRTDRFRVEDIIGRTVVIHSGPDDFRSQPAGSAANKFACGVIRRR